MLEALFQAGSWLLRDEDNFAKPLVELREAKGIKYQGFVAPGDLLEVEAVVAKRDGEVFTLKATGSVADRTAVSGRLVLERVDMGQTRQASTAYENYVREELRRQWRLLRPPGLA
jgi:3-hydroxyacyl-[acyl-carrier-protein] dehydratase